MAKDLKKRYIEGIKTAGKDKYCRHVAEVLGLDPATVCASTPARHFEEFVRNVDKYADKWLNNLKEAFTS